MGGNLDNSASEPSASISLIRHWIAEGDRALNQGIGQAETAIHCFNQAIQLGEETSVAINDEGCHLMGWAWMNHGNVWMLHDTAEAIQAAIESYSKAAHFFAPLHTSDNHKHLVDAGALYSNIGQAYFRQGRPEHIPIVLQHYAQAAAILENLPWRTHLRYCHHLAALWLNCGNLYWLAREAIPTEEALASYQKALSYANELPRSEARYARLTSSIWLNNGNVCKESAKESERRYAATCFTEAKRILRPHAKQDAPDICLELASILANQANHLAIQIDSESEFLELIETAKEALNGVTHLEKDNILAAQISINAQRALCQAYGFRLYKMDGMLAESFYQEATDIADAGLELIRYWEHRGMHHLRPLAHRFFRLGEQLYRIRQPRFLAEFLLDQLDPERSEGALYPDHEMMAIAHQSLEEAIAHADTNCLLIADTEESKETLEIYADYLATLRRLEHLRAL
ncbi:hypothetical protein ACWPKO_05905 [Coraliomargarita sp. W4R53]